MRQRYVDLLHRGTILTLVGISAYGLFLGYSVHTHTLERGKAVMAELEKNKIKDLQEVEKEEQWARVAAQEALAAKSKSST